MAMAIFVTGVPLGLFEHRLWIEFFHKLRPSFKVPNRKLVSTTLLEKEFGAMETEITKQLTDVPNLYLQFDGWSNIRNESIINFIISQPTPFFIKFLETKDNAHDSDYLFKQVEEVILKYGPEKFFVVIGDNAANVQAALDKIHEKYPHIVTLGCIAHMLNLLSSDIGKCKSVQKIITNSKAIIKKVKRSHMIGALLSKIQNENNIKSSLKLPGKTRFGSNCISLQSLSKNRNALQILAVNDTIKDKIPSRMRSRILSDTFWNNIEVLIKILEPILKANIELEGDGILIHKVYSTFHGLGNNISDVIHSCNLLTEKEKNDVSMNFKHRKDLAIKTIHLAADFIDPNKRGAKLNSRESIDAIEFIFETARNMSLDTDIILSQIAMYKDKDDLWSKSFVWSATEKMCPVKWWKTFYSETLLAKVAIRILSAPISSAATERSNSKFGWIHSSKRNRFKTQRAGKITYLSYNWNLLNPRPKKIKESKLHLPSTSQTNVEEPDSEWSDIEEISSTDTESDSENNEVEE